MFLIVTFHRDFMLVLINWIFELHMELLLIVVIFGELVLLIQVVILFKSMKALTMHQHVEKLQKKLTHLKHRFLKHTLWSLHERKTAFLRLSCKAYMTVQLGLRTASQLQDPMYIYFVLRALRKVKKSQIVRFRSGQKHLRCKFWENFSFKATIVRKLYLCQGCY